MAMENSNNFDNLFKIAKRVKTFGIISAIIMIILGGIAIFSPLLGQSILIWSMVIGLFISGVEEIVNFFSTPKGSRNGFSLAIGIIWVVLFILLFISAVSADAISNLYALGAFDYFLAIMVAFSCIFEAINQFCLCGVVSKAGFGKGGLIASGILRLIAGIIILSFPIGSIITLEIFYAVFLVIGGISLLCTCLSFKNR